MKNKNKSLINLILLFSLTVMSPIRVMADSGHEHNHENSKECEKGSPQCSPSMEKEDGHEEHGEEGVIQLTDETLISSKIEVRKADSATLSMQLRVNGRISPVSSNVAHIASRFSGVIREVKKDVGDKVAAGDILAIVESNQNLQKFEVRALKEGVVTDRHATIGESIKEDEALFVVMDLSQLWADFTVFQRDVSTVKIGQGIDIYISGRNEPFKSQLSFISPIVDETTQSRTARAVVSNSDNTLAPGAFVTGKIAIANYQVPIAVTYNGIQTIEGKDFVFVKEEDRFEKREISVGRSDGTYTEVLSGIKVGEQYAATNSFTLKAELGKSEAEHEH